jgi:hypothetical protein
VISSKTYSSRSAAKRAAVAEIRRLLNAPFYQPTEGFDFGLIPQVGWQSFSKTPNRYELRGPALDAARA